jgi:hypothetical protein
MKHDIPEWAYTLTPIDPPTKQVLDNDAMFTLLEAQEFVVVRVDPSQDRVNSIGAVESPVIKAINAHVRTVKGRKLFVRRLCEKDWLIFLDRTTTKKGA